MHTTGGYLLYAGMTHELIFDYHPEQVYWCTADIGWVTGHTYIVYGPLANGATGILFEGVPSYPSPDRFWAVVEKYKVNIFYTAPTALRSIAREGDDWVKKHDLSSLRVLGTVGEPINPEVWLWYHDLIGGGRCPIVDTWWQTETGGILITPLPGAMKIKPGSATLPFFGVEPVLVDEDGNEITGPGVGNLCMKRPWPGMMRGVYGEPERFNETYFVQYPGFYFTGDGCRRDEDGYHWITGRVDDVINVSGHRMGTAEVESALVSHAGCRRSGRRGHASPHQGPGHLRLRDAERRRRAVGRSEEGTRQARAHGDRPHRHSGRHPVGPRPAEDPQRQDHAPHPQEDRRERRRRSGRHLHPGRPERGRQPGGAPREPVSRAPLPVREKSGRSETQRGGRKAAPFFTRFG